MGLDFAIDELFSTGWSTSDPKGCEHTPDGRLYPGVDRVKSIFREAGLDLTIRYVQLFDCYRAEWRDGTDAAGAVVGQSEEEAAVYALAHHRRQTAGAGA